MPLLGYLPLFQVSVAPIVPPIALYLSKHESVANYNLSNLRLIFSGAAPLGGGLQHELAERLKVPNTLQGSALDRLTYVPGTYFLNIQVAFST